MQKTHAGNVQAELTVGVGEFPRTRSWIEGARPRRLHRVLLGGPDVGWAAVAILGGKTQPPVYREIGDGVLLHEGNATEASKINKDEAVKVLYKDKSLPSFSNTAFLQSPRF